MSAIELKMLPQSEYFAADLDDPIRQYTKPLFGKLYRRRVAMCISLLPPGGKVLEIGYGSGVGFLNLAEKFDRISGVDLHPCPRQVQSVFQRHGMNPDLRQGGISNLPYDNESFDAAIAISIHEHLQPDEQAKAMSEVRRCLKPNGTYVIGVPCSNVLMTIAFLMLGYWIHRHHFSSERQVLSTMRDHFDIDTVLNLTPMLPRRFSTYLALRGRKPATGSRNGRTDTFV